VILKLFIILLSNENFLFVKLFNSLIEALCPPQADSVLADSFEFRNPFLRQVPNSDNNIKKMKKVVIIILGVIFFLNSAFANGQISETEKLALTGKIWGFLKYYHPNVAAGKFNWDQELFRILPKVKASSTKEDLSQVYLEWIQGLGRVKECKKCKTVSKQETFDKNFNLNWISNSKILTSTLVKELIYIEQNRHQGKKHYVTTYKKVGNINITNEPIYKNLDWTNEDLRLLTLFRYWNIVEYFFPYKYQTDTNWDEVLNQFIAKFLQTKTELDFHLAMLELIVSIDDSHAGLYTEIMTDFFGKYMMPAYCEVIEDKVVITRFFNEAFAEKDDLRIGDVITKIDGQSLEDIFSNRSKYISGSNIPRKRHNAYHAILKGSTDDVTIEYIRDNQTKTKKVSRYLYEDFNYKPKVSTESFKMLEGNIGYVNMGVLTIEEVPTVMEALKDTKSIIFDIRNYPKGTLYSIAYYINSAERDFYKVTSPDLNYPGKFIWRNGAACGYNGDLKYKGQVLLLVNEKSQSHAEFTIMCLQTGDNVTTIGSQTSGADGNVSLIEMVGGEKTMITGIGIFYPDKTETQRKGIKIDVIVNPTIESIIEGKDEVLEKAIALVKK
jgi:carboxyl-terminal processing protease